MNLVQIRDSKGKRRVGLVEGGSHRAAEEGGHHARPRPPGAEERPEARRQRPRRWPAATTEDYAAALRQKRVLTPVDHPDPAHCIITGTGLTHLGSASARDAMHKKLSGAKEGTHRQPEDVQDGPRRRQAQAQGARPGCSPNGSTRATARGWSALAQPLPTAVLRARRRRGAGTAGPLPDRRQGPPGAPRLCAGQ